jgi:hypothetical protein
VLDVATFIVCLRSSSLTDSRRVGQLSRYGINFPLIAWHCSQQLELPFRFAPTCPAWSLGPCCGCSSSAASDVHLFLFLSFLSQVFTGMPGKASQFPGRPGRLPLGEVMSICSTHHRRCCAEKGAEWVRRWRAWLKTRAARCGVHGACRTLCFCDNSNAPRGRKDLR